MSMSWPASHVSPMREQHLVTVTEEEREGEKQCSQMNYQCQMYNALLCVSCDSLPHRTTWLMDACRLCNGLGVQY